MSSSGGEGAQALDELRELLVPGFGPAPEVLVGAGGIGLSNPATGTVVPPFQYSFDPAGGIIDDFVVPSGYFLVGSGTAPGGSGFRLTNPLSFRWSGTTSTPPLQLTWQAGTLFDNVLNGFSGGFVPFRIVSAGSSREETPSAASGLTIAAVPVSEEHRLIKEPSSERGPSEAGDLQTGSPDGKETVDVFESFLQPPASKTPPGAPSEAPSEDLADEAADPASVPGPLPVAGVAIAWRCSRRLRQRLRQVR